MPGDKVCEKRGKSPLNAEIRQKIDDLSRWKKKKKSHYAAPRALKDKVVSNRVGPPQSEEKGSKKIYLSWGDRGPHLLQ